MVGCYVFENGWSVFVVVLIGVGKIVVGEFVIYFVM